MDGFMVYRPSSKNMNSLPLNPEQQEIKSACGGILKDPSRYPSAMFNGERVYFCADACLKAFLSAPEAFMAGEVEHPLEDETPES
jgi:YHS domain-containing protein